MKITRPDCTIYAAPIKKVDFLVYPGSKPWFSVGVKLSDTEPFQAIRYFQECLNIPYNYQVFGLSGIEWFKRNVRVTSADKFLGNDCIKIKEINIASIESYLLVVISAQSCRWKTTKKPPFRWLADLSSDCLKRISIELSGNLFVDRLLSCFLIIIVVFG